MSPTRKQGMIPLLARRAPSFARRSPIFAQRALTVQWMMRLATAVFEAHSMLLLAHRGHCARAVENTYEAFEQALALGADGIETDIRLSADGQAVLLHDRIVNGAPVSKLTWEEICTAKGFTVPTLSQAVARWPNIFWNLEIKLPEAAAAIADVVERHPHTRFLVTSFWHPVIEELGRVLPVDLGLLVAHCSSELPVSLAWLERHPRVGAVVWHFERLERKQLQLTADAGLQNFVWDPQTPEEHARLLELPVHGVISDHLEMAVASLRRGRQAGVSVGSPEILVAFHAYVVDLACGLLNLPRSACLHRCQEFVRTLVEVADMPLP